MPVAKTPMASSTILSIFPRVSGRLSIHQVIIYSLIAIGLLIYAFKSSCPDIESLRKGDSAQHFDAQGFEADEEPEILVDPDGDSYCYEGDESICHTREYQALIHVAVEGFERLRKGGRKPIFRLATAFGIPQDIGALENIITTYERTKDLMTALEPISKRPLVARMKSIVLVNAPLSGAERIIAILRQYAHRNQLRIVDPPIGSVFRSREDFENIVANTRPKVEQVHMMLAGVEGGNVPWLREAFPEATTIATFQHPLNRTVSAYYTGQDDRLRGAEHPVFCGDIEDGMQWFNACRADLSNAVFSYIRGNQSTITKSVNQYDFVFDLSKIDESIVNFKLNMGISLLDILTYYPEANHSHLVPGQTKEFTVAALRENSLDLRSHFTAIERLHKDINNYGWEFFVDELEIFRVAQAGVFQFCDDVGKMSDRWTDCLHEKFGCGRTAINLWYRNRQMEIIKDLHSKLKLIRGY